MAVYSTPFPHLLREAFVYVSFIQRDDTAPEPILKILPTLLYDCYVMLVRRVNVEEA
jgi:hypothetical protein